MILPARTRELRLKRNFIFAIAIFIPRLLCQPSGAPEQLILSETSLCHLPPRSTPKAAPGDDSYASSVRGQLLQALGGFIAVADFDGDGRPDVDVVTPGGANYLLRNDASSALQDVTAKAHVAGSGASISVTFNDYDRSGRPSLFIAGAGGVTLYHNNGDGTFTDRTQRAGLRGRAGEVITRALLADIDDDGFPDLLLTAYTDLDQRPRKAAFTFPNDIPGTLSRLYRNNGNGTFMEITAAAGLAGNPGRARSAVVADLNNDDLPDLLLLRDDKPPVLYLNRGGGKFEDGTWDAGEALTRHAFFDGAVADFNRDGKPDLALWSTLSFRVLLNGGNAAFEPAESVPLLRPVSDAFGFRGAVADLSGTGFEEVITLDHDSRWRFFANRDGHFHEASLGFRTPSPSSSHPADFVALAPARLRDRTRLTFLALRTNGQLSLIEVSSNPKGNYAEFHSFILRS